MVLFDELREKFPDLVSPSPAPLPVAHNQVSIALRGPDVREIAGHLISAYGSRLVAVFAEDRVAAEDVFYNYYVFEQLAEPCYVILQAPIPPPTPTSASCRPPPPRTSRDSHPSPPGCRP